MELFRREVETLSDTCRACRSVRDYEDIYPFCDRLGGDDCTDEYREYRDSGICDNCGGSGIFGAGLFDSGGGGRRSSYSSYSADYGGGGGRGGTGGKCTKFYYDYMRGPGECPNGYYQANEGARDDRTLVIGLSVLAGVSTLLLFGMAAYHFRRRGSRVGRVEAADMRGINYSRQ